jgi:hypothetical protein
VAIFLLCLSFLLTSEHWSHLQLVHHFSYFSIFSISLSGWAVILINFRHLIQLSDHLQVYLMCGLVHSSGFKFQLQYNIFHVLVSFQICLCPLSSLFLYFQVYSLFLWNKNIFFLFCEKKIFFKSFSYWDLNWGLHLEPPRQLPFFVMGFFEIGSCELFAPGWPKAEILLISATWVVRITSVSHWPLAIKHNYFIAGNCNIGNPCSLKFLLFLCYFSPMLPCFFIWSWFIK